MTLGQKQRTFTHMIALLVEYAYTQLELVQSGAREKPSPEALILELPQFILK